MELQQEIQYLPTNRLVCVKRSRCIFIKITIIINTTLNKLDETVLMEENEPIETASRTWSKREQFDDDFCQPDIPDYSDTDTKNEEIRETPSLTSESEDKSTDVGRGHY